MKIKFSKGGIPGNYVWFVDGSYVLWLRWPSADPFGWLKNYIHETQTDSDQE